jgi:hypothetical protein
LAAVSPAVDALDCAVTAKPTHHVSISRLSYET